MNLTLEVVMGPAVRVGVGVLAVIVVATTMVAGRAFGADPAPNPPRPVNEPVGVEPRLATAEQERERTEDQGREAARASAEAKRDRTASRSAFRDRGDAEARAIAGRQLPPAPVAGPHLLAGQRIAGYVSDFAARLDNGAGNPETLLFSHTPLRSSVGTAALRRSTSRFAMSVALSRRSTRRCRSGCRARWVTASR